jgi:NitT/TauT family transport system permease protein
MKHIRVYLAPLLFVLIWQWSSWSGIVPYYKLPSPLQVIVAVRDLAVVGVPPGHLLYHHLFYSLYRVLWGLGIAAAIGIPLGICMGWSKSLSELVNPLVEVVRPIPPLAWVPIAILWFGLGIKSAAFIIFLGAFFPILLNATSGVHSINPVLIDAARTLGATERDVFLKVLIPGTVPALFTGMRIAVGVGWMTLVAAEFVGVEGGYGLGYMIMAARDIQRPDEILAGMIVIGLTGLLINMLLRFVELRIIQWK